MKLKFLWPALAGFVVLPGCGGGGGDGGSPPPPPPPSVTVGGVVTFDRVPHDSGTGALDYGATFQSPVRGAVVEAIDAGGGITILDSTLTDETGAYSLTVAANTQMFVRVKAQMATPAWNFRVIDNTNGGALYALDNASFSSGSGATRDLNAGSGWGGAFYDGVRAAGPFAILDSVYVAFNKVLEADPATVFPGLDVNWSVNNVPVGGDPDAGEIGTSFYNGVAIFLLGREDNDTDEYDGHVIIHEWGHYFEAQFARSDSIGGSHSGSDYLDMRLAFGEGWGNAFSAIATDDPFYRDSFGSQQQFGFNIDVESNNTVPVPAANNGWFSSASVQSIIYDVYDPASDGVDAVSLGFAPIFDVLTGEQSNTPALTSIFPFIAALKAANPSEAANIDAVVQGQGIASANIDAFGTGETNNAGNAQDVLPVYTPIVIGGGSVQVCSIGGVAADPGTFNKLSVSRFLRFTVSAQGSFTFMASGAVGDDPDMILHDTGTRLAISEETNPDGTETFSQSLSPGEYVLEVYEFGNLLPPAAGRTCFDITIT